MRAEPEDPKSLHLTTAPHQRLRVEPGELALTTAPTFSPDVLIPCASGEKRPAFEYKDGLWSWDKFDEVMQERGAQELAQVDWAIVLRDLCVIDCDSPEVSCPTRTAPKSSLQPSSPAR